MTRAATERNATTIRLTPAEYSRLDDCRQYVYELMQRADCDRDALAFIEETLSMLESNCE